MKTLKIAALALLLSTPLTHAMDDDCSIGNQLFFVGFAGLCVYKGIPLIMNTVKGLDREIKQINDEHEWKKSLICREETDTDNINLPDMPTNQITFDELITITHQGSSEHDLETAKKSEIKERKKYALITGCTMSAMCLTSLLGLYTVYQCNTQN